MTTVPINKLHTIAYAINKLAAEDNLFPAFDLAEYPAIKSCLEAIKDPSLRTVKMGSYNTRTLFQEACQIVHRYSYSNTCRAWALMIAQAAYVKV